MPLSFPGTATLQKLWGSLASCVAVGNRHAGRFNRPAGSQPAPQLLQAYLYRPRKLSTPFRKFDNVSRNRLLTRAARIRATTVKGVVPAEYVAELLK